MGRSGAMYCETCETELTVDNVAEAVADQMPTKCQECVDEECAFCGLPGNNYWLYGDKVCMHCAHGHRRVRFFGDGRATPVHGPCNCGVV